MSPRGAVHNALSRGQLSSALSRAVGDDVGSSGLERYGETLTPILDLWRQPEWAYLRNEVLAVFEKGQVAVAGELSIVALVNPTGSGKLMVVESIKAWVAAQALLAVQLVLEGVITATLGASAVPQSVDTRWRDRVTGADKTSAIVYSGSDAVGLGGQIERFTQPAGGNEFAHATTSVPLILRPGWGVAVVHTVANIAMQVAMRHRERQAFPGELE